MTELAVMETMFHGEQNAASELAQRMAKVRAAKKAKAEARKAARENPQTEQPEGRQSTETDPFVSQRITHVREQIEKLASELDEMLKAKPLDTRKVKETSEALSRLSTIEREWSGRPTPGAYRPSLKAKRNFGASRLRA